MEKEEPRGTLIRIYWISVFLYAAMIFALSSISPEEELLGGKTYHLDKALHFLLYMGFGFLLFLAFSSSSKVKIRRYAFLLAVVVAFLYGVSDEYHQSFVPNRTAEALDLVADTLGAAAAQAIVFAREKRGGT